MTRTVSDRGRDIWEPQPMPLITYVEHDGTARAVDVALGKTVMEGAREQGLAGIVAECGGACSCATCHCYIDDEWLARVGPAGGAEAELVAFVAEPRDTSRLSCQVVVTAELDGLVVHLPETQV
jgi:2Fe-2S ferredoxin